MEKDPVFVKDLDAKAARGDAQCQAASVCLQAMRGVICQQGCAGSATAYFACTVMTLQKQLQQANALDGNNVSALLLILRKSMAAVPAAVVSSRLNDVIAVLDRVLKAPDQEDLMKQVLGCLAAVAGLAFDAGSRPNRKVLKPVFACLADTRAPVRQRAQLAATAILRRSSATGDKQSLEFAAQQLSQMFAAARADKRSLDELPVQHAVSLLKNTANDFPADCLGEVLVALVSLPGKLGQHPCCTEAFEFLAEHLRKEEEDEDEDDDEEGEEKMKVAVDTSADKRRAELSATILPGLLGVPVAMLNVAYLVAFMRALSAAATALTTEVGLSSVPSRESGPQKLAVVSKLFGLSSERDPTLLKNLREEALRLLASAGEGGDLSFLDEMPEACKTLLSYERKAVLQHTLPIITGVFDAIGEIRYGRVEPAAVVAWTAARFQRSASLLQQLAEARDKARGAEYAVFGKELDKCIGSAIATFGPEHMLSVTKLQLLEHPLTDPDYEQKSRSWLMLLLKENTCRTNLALFQAEFLPLASALRQRATQAEASSSVVAKKYSTLMEQVWSLLPALCDEPLDLGSAMMADGGKLAKQLVNVMLNEPQLRDFVWMAFARLNNSVLEPPTTLSEKLQESNRTCLKTLSSRVLPEMFSAFVKMHSEAEGKDESRTSHSRRLALDAVQSYARVAEPSLVANFFKTAVARLLKATTGQDPSVPITQAEPLADLANALIPHLPVESLEVAMKVFSPMLTGVAAPGSDEDGKKVGSIAANLQKSAYRAICGILQHSATADPQQATAEKVLGFWGMLKDNRQTCGAVALKGRLAAIEALLNLLQERLTPILSQAPVRKAYLDCLATVLPEILFHLRDQSTSVRDASRECLRVAAETAIESSLQTEIVALLSAGLAGLTPHSKASAIDALSRLLYEHNAKMTRALQDRLIAIVLMLLQDDEATVYRAALKFAKVVVFIVPKENLAGPLPQLMHMFESDHMWSSKMLVRRIVERLAKLLPADALQAAFPKDHAPLLHYVQKQLARKQRPKTVLQSGGGEDEDEEEEDQKPGRRRKAKKSKAMDVEMDDDDDDDGPKKKSYADFQAGDDDATGDGPAGGSKKRSRNIEPATSRVAAHEAVQQLLDSWEDEEEGKKPGKREREGGGKRKHGTVLSSTWIREDQDAPLDFMSSDAAHSVMTTRQPQQKRRRGEEVGKSGATSREEALRREGLKFAEDGRLVVEDMEEPEEKGEDDDEEGGFSHGTAGKKVGALSKLAEMRKNRAEAKRAVKVERRRNHQMKGMEQYKPKNKSQGDARRKGQKLEPFAYISLNPKVTKEKFKERATKSFAKVVQGAKKGIVKGLKAKNKDAKVKKSAEDRKLKRKAHATKSHKRGSR